MERKQTSPDSVEEFWQKIKQSKKVFREEQQKLSFNEKMKIAFEMQKRDEKLRKAIRISSS